MWEKEGDLRFHQCHRQGGEDYQASNWGDNFLKILQELYMPIAIFQFGDKYQGMQDNAFEGRLIIVKDFPKID